MIYVKNKQYINDLQSLSTWKNYMKLNNDINDLQSLSTWKNLWR